MLERDPDIAVVDEVGSVQDALVSARRLRPRLMVIDVELPDGSGVEVVRGIVAENLPIRCLMLSAHDDYVYFSEALVAGAGGYLLKTASAAEFVAAARTVSFGGTVIDGSLAHRLAGRRRAPEEELIHRLTARELDVIAEAHRLAIPIFGICFGAQALCRFHGGVVSPSSVPEIGWYEVEEQNDSGIAPGPWFEYHYDECTLPEGARLWATSPRSVQAFSIGRNVGVQFHPEVDDLQLEEWFAADDEDDIREFGAMHAALVARTKLETPAARLRAVELVDIVLDHFSTWAQTTA